MQPIEAARRGARLVSAKLTGSAVPFHVTLYVNTACNLRCVYCASPEQHAQLLSAAQWRSVLDELRELGTERVLFFGGEPLLRPDLEEIVTHARGLGLHCALTSNGTLVPRRPEVIRRLHVLVVSVDGDAEAHDRNRGAGSHADAMHAIEAARGWGVAVRANAVLNATSAASLPWLLDWSRRERVPVTLNLMRSEDNGLWKDAAAHRLDDDRLRALIDAILDAKRTNPWIVFSRESYELARRWPDFARDRLPAVETGADFPGPRCSAGRFHCAIYADGSLYPCTLTVHQVPALNVVTAGVAAALARAGEHGCATCFSPCMLEVNGLFALRPRVVAGLARRVLRRDVA
jgi:MoaA/NifB/PqqE/SkfB family radical SAM enzyme